MKNSLTTICLLLLIAYPTFAQQNKPKLNFKVKQKQQPSSSQLGPGKPVNGVSIVYSKDYLITLGGIEKLHPFDIHKYDHIYQALVADGSLTASSIYVPSEITRDQLLLVHTGRYLESLKSKKAIAQYLEAPFAKLFTVDKLEKKVLRPFRLSSGGTLLAARQALANPAKISINLGGGFHHAKPNTGEGFCIYADVPIAIRQLQKEQKIKTALVVDLDVHQGNGTIQCAQGDASIYTFSMHEGSIYPHPKEIGSEDIELPLGMDDAAYLALLKSKLKGLFSRANNPDIVFYVAGCDPLRGDPLANLNLSPQGIVKRDQMIIEACRSHHTPVVMTLSGGYSENAWQSQYQSVRNILSLNKKVSN